MHLSTHLQVFGTMNGSADMTGWTSRSGSVFRQRHYRSCRWWKAGHFLDNVSRHIVGRSRRRRFLYGHFLFSLFRVGGVLLRSDFASAVHLVMVAAGLIRRWWWCVRVCIGLRCRSCCRSERFDGAFHGHCGLQRRRRRGPMVRPLSRWRHKDNGWSLRSSLAVHEGRARQPA